MKIVISKNGFSVKVFWLLIVASSWACSASAGDGSIPVPGPSRSVLAGYGETHPHLGRTRTRVETVDIVLRYDLPLTGRTGQSWYEGYHSLMVELPISLPLYPNTDPIIGLTFLGAWFFSDHDKWQPYVFAGGGMVYTAADIEGLGSELNGNWQLGAGIRYSVTTGTFVNLEYRFHHISNLNTKEPNDPLNASKLMLGVTF